MMPRMNYCEAEGIKRVGDRVIVVICNLKPHEGPEHYDVVHGDWTSKEQQ